MANTAKRLLHLLFLLGVWAAFWSSPIQAHAQVSFHYQSLPQAYGGSPGSFFASNFIIARHGLLITQYSNQDASYQSQEIDLSAYAEDYFSVALAVPHNAVAEGAFSVSMAFRYGENEWSAPEVLVASPQQGEVVTGHRWLSQPIEVPAGAVAMRFALGVSSRPVDAHPIVFQPCTLHLTRIGGMPEVAQQPLRYQFNGEQNRPCEHPGYLARNAWQAPDPDTQAHSCLSPEYAPVTHAVVAKSYTADQSQNWAAQVLGLWSFHVNVLGYCDIGYNWLIDPDGVIYEGRGGGLTVVGQYLCSGSRADKLEIGTTGICMLGTSPDRAATPEQQHSLRQLLAWQMSQSNLQGDEVINMLRGPAKVPVITEVENLCGSAHTLNLVDDALRLTVKGLVNQCFTDTVTALAEVTPAASVVQVFPNPNRGRFQVAIGEIQAPAVYLQLINLQGQVQFQQRYPLTHGQQQISLNLPSLPTGLYYLQVKDANRIVSRVVRVEN